MSQNTPGPFGGHDRLPFQLRNRPAGFGNVGSHIGNNSFYVVHPSVTLGYGC